MINYKRCPCCRGAKKINGMGGMIRDCLECKGIGHVEIAEQTIKPVIIDEIKSNDDIADNQIDIVKSKNRDTPYFEIERLSREIEKHKKPYKPRKKKRVKSPQPIDNVITINDPA